MNNIQLHFTITSSLYPKPLYHKIEHYTGKPLTYLFETNFGVKNNNLNYKILKDEDNLLITDITIGDKVKYIGVNNTIGAIIFECGTYNKYNGESWQFVNDTLSNLYSTLFLHDSELNNNKDHWLYFITEIHHRAKLEGYKNWQNIKIDGYELVCRDIPVEIYGGCTSNGNVLIGFNFSNIFNYFTNTIIKSAETKVEKEDYNFNKINITVNNKTYNLDLDNKESFIRMYIDMCNTYKDFNDSFTYIKIDKITMSMRNAEYLDILVENDGLTNIEFIDKQNRKIGLQELINKMSIIGVNRITIDNVIIDKAIISNKCSILVKR